MTEAISNTQKAAEPYFKKWGLDFLSAAERLKKIVNRTPLMYNHNLSRKYGCNVFLKREDLQVVRSYKLRGAYNMMSNLSPEQLKRGVVCASAGNHAQGFAYSCKQLACAGVVFMPVITPNQKVNQTKMFGENFIEVILTGDTYEDCSAAAKKYMQETGMVFIPPFDDLKIIEGQGTVGVEILDELAKVDYLFMPVGGGGLCSGVGAYFKSLSPNTKIIGAEPEGAPSMYRALEAGKPVTLENIEQFVRMYYEKKMKISEKLELKKNKFTRKFIKLSIFIYIFLRNIRVYPELFSKNIGTVQWFYLKKN